MIVHLIFIYFASIFILVALQAKVAEQVNNCYAGKVYFFGKPNEYKKLLESNNQYVRLLSILLPWVNFTKYYYT